MSEHILTRNLSLDLSPERTFAFFADASNLERITPPQLNFRIVTPQPFEMKEGTVIDYRLRLRGLPLKWRTLISEWDPPRAFTDEALKSPYKQWIHRHIFTPNEAGGTNIKDEVRYRLPFEPLGDIFHWYVRRELEHIFDFRQKTVRRILGETDR